MRNVTLILDDGSRFHGKSFGYEKPVAGEVVFELDRPFVCRSADDADLPAGR